MSESKQKDGKIIFDYIVVGSGPAGSVLAKKLTDDKKTSVLVLEAGENNDRDTPISDSTFALELEELYLPQYFWQGEGVPQEKVNERSFEWTTGRLLGGGTSINTQQYVRPTSAVFQQWEKDLIVADDSIIPFTVDGNTSAPAYLIGNTIAQQLLKQNSRDNKKR